MAKIYISIHHLSLFLVLYSRAEKTSFFWAALIGAIPEGVVVLIFLLALTVNLFCVLYQSHCFRLLASCLFLFQIGLQSIFFPTMYLDCFICIPVFVLNLVDVSKPLNSERNMIVLKSLQDVLLLAHLVIGVVLMYLVCFTDFKDLPYSSFLSFRVMESTATSALQELAGTYRSFFDTLIMSGILFLLSTVFFLKKKSLINYWAAVLVMYYLLLTLITGVSILSAVTSVLVGVFFLNSLIKDGGARLYEPEINEARHGHS